MRVLVACEVSGVVRDAFIAKGHDAWSCDLLPTDVPGPHIEGDVLDHLDEGWDLMIAFPPCQHLTVSGARWFAGKQAEQEHALNFIKNLMQAPIPRIAIENPIGIISTRIREHDQIIQPFEFGHDAMKSTCLWLKGLPLLKPTQYIPPSHPGDGRMVYENQTPSGQNRLGQTAGRAKKRATTYAGIAQAMADQWVDGMPLQIGMFDGD